MHNTHHRFVVSPGHGRFVAVAEDGAVVEEGCVIGRVESSTRTDDLVAPCRAFVAGVLVCEGDRVQPGKPLIHLEAL